MNHLHFSSCARANCGRDKWVLWMHLDDFADIVEPFAVNWNTEGEKLIGSCVNCDGILLRLGNVEVENLITRQNGNKARILHRPVKVHQRRVGLEAVERLTQLQAVNEEISALDADDEFVLLLGIEFYASH